MEEQYEKRISKGCSSLLEKINSLFDDHLLLFWKRRKMLSRLKLELTYIPVVATQPWYSQSTPPPPPHTTPEFSSDVTLVNNIPNSRPAWVGLEATWSNGRCRRASKDPVSNKGGLAAFTPVAQLVANRSRKHVYVTTIYILVRYLMIPDHKQSVAALFNDKTHIQ